MSRVQAGLHVTENLWFLFPGQRVPQLDKVAIGSVGRQKGFVEKQNATDRQFDGFHRRQDHSSTIWMMSDPIRG
jgi:hypothetical protein